MPMICPELSFPVATYRISAIMQDDFTLPAYAGSMLRGIYGHALRRISCMTGKRTCQGCPLIATCPYPELFDPAINKIHRGRDVTSAPAPYVIQAPSWGARELEKNDELIFNIRLFGHAAHRLPFVVQAWRQALGRGLGRGRNRAAAIIRHIDWIEGEQRIFDDQQGQIISHEPLLPRIQPREKPADIAISFETPYRSQQQGHPLSVAKITPRRLIVDIIRRIRLLDDFHGTGLNDRNWPVDLWLDMADQIDHTKDLRWQDWRRYSNRQHTAMTLGGIMGRWEWQQVPPELVVLLRIGAILHVGKQTVFGFGHMSVL